MRAPRWPCHVRQGQCSLSAKQNEWNERVKESRVCGRAFWSTVVGRHGSSSVPRTRSSSVSKDKVCASPLRSLCNSLRMLVCVTLRVKMLSRLHHKITSYSVGTLWGQETHMLTYQLADLRRQAKFNRYFDPDEAETVKRVAKRVCFQYVLSSNWPRTGPVTVESGKNRLGQDLLPMFRIFHSWDV
jgi:hypothetical protein